jgi:hypothetical protein
MSHAFILALRNNQTDFFNIKNLNTEFDFNTIKETTQNIFTTMMQTLFDVCSYLFDAGSYLFDTYSYLFDKNHKYELIICIITYFMIISLIYQEKFYHEKINDLQDKINHINKKLELQNDETEYLLKKTTSNNVKINYLKKEVNKIKKEL